MIKIYKKELYQILIKIMSHIINSANFLIKYFQKCITNLVVLKTYSLSDSSKKNI